MSQRPFERFPGRRRRLLYWFTIIFAALSVVINLNTKSMMERDVWAPVSIELLTLVLFTMRRTRFYRIW